MLVGLPCSPTLYRYNPYSLEYELAGKAKGLRYYTRSTSLYALKEYNNATTTLRNYIDITPLASYKTYTSTIVIATDTPTVIDIL